MAEPDEKLGQALGPAGHPDEVAEAELIRRVELAREGDRQAQAWLFDRYWRRVVGLCLSFESLDPADAQDAAQDAFVRALRSLSGLRRPERFGAWLLAIARRRCLTELARAGRRREEQRRWAAEQSAGGDGRQEEAMRQAEIEIVAQEIARQADSGQARAGRLFYREGRSTAEIAAALEVPQSTVTTWLARFRARLRRRLIARILALRGAGEVGP